MISNCMSLKLTAGPSLQHFVSVREDRIPNGGLFGSFFSDVVGSYVNGIAFKSRGRFTAQVTLLAECIRHNHYLISPN